MCLYTHRLRCCCSTVGAVVGVQGIFLPSGSELPFRTTRGLVRLVSSPEEQKVQQFSVQTHVKFFPSVVLNLLGIKTWIWQQKLKIKWDQKKRFSNLFRFVIDVAVNGGIRVLCSKTLQIECHMSFLPVPVEGRAGGVLAIFVTTTGPSVGLTGTKYKIYIYKNTYANIRHPYYLYML